MDMIYLNGLTQADSELAFHWRNKAEYNQFFRQVGLLTSAQQDEWFKSVHNDKKQSMFAIKKDLATIGICGLTNIDFINRKAEISCYSKDWHEENEYEAISQLVDVGFNSFGLHRIWAETFETHTCHLCVLAKLGFKEEGRLKHSYFKNGQWIDSIIHAIVRQT
jgi:RimJ/RimL family protein N-acetyltransferase